MKFRILPLLLTVILVSCKKEVKPEDIAKINGYWEIEKVILPNGETKDYSINTTVDYFEINNNVGIRKKVTPQIDGKYSDNGHGEKVSVITKDGKIYLNYATEYAKWHEEIVEIGDSTLVSKNEQKLEYHYKKHIPFTLK